MNYTKHYGLLIAKHGSVIKPDYPSERHHIAPKCLGGSDDEDNLIYLSPEAHYVAHQLLVKMHPDNPGIVLAARLMAYHAPNLHSRNNKLYGWLRTRWLKSSRGIGHPRYGKKHSDETKKLMSEKKQDYCGDKNSFYGRKHSAESKAKMSETWKKRVANLSKHKGNKDEQV